VQTTCTQYATVGLTPNKTKGTIYAQPTSTTTLNPNHFAKAIELGCPINHEGILACGTPIGTDIFIQNHLKNHITDLQTECLKLEKAATLQPVATSHILPRSLSKHGSKIHPPL
jgi:hypothetical protein